MTNEKKKHRGFILTETVMGLAILGVLVAMLAMALYGFRRFNHYQFVRQRCTAAAQAQLDSIAVTAEAIGEKDFERLWPKLSISIEKTAGQGQWEGMKLVRVKATGESFERNVEVELARYVLAGEED